MDTQRPQYALKFVGLPTWRIDLVDDIERASEYGENWAHNKMIISFKARFALPPQDDPDCVVLIKRTFSAPLDNLINTTQQSDINDSHDLIKRMFQSILFPLFVGAVDDIIARVNTIADRHRADLSAATTPVALRMNVNISSLLHEIPDIYFDYHGRGSEDVTDIADLIDNDSRRAQIFVEQVIPYYHNSLSYDERERIFQRNQVVYSESDDDDFDASSLPITFLPARKDSIRSLEKVTVDVVSISRENCSICLEDFSVGTEATRLPCSHHYHPDCIVKWLEISKFCPLCRFEL